MSFFNPALYSARGLLCQESLGTLEPEVCYNRSSSLRPWCIRNRLVNVTSVSQFVPVLCTDVQIILHSVVSVVYLVKRAWELWSQKCVLIVFSVNVNSQLTMLIKPKGRQAQRRVNPPGLRRWNCEKTNVSLFWRFEEQSILSRIGFLLLWRKAGEEEKAFLYRQRKMTWQHVMRSCCVCVVCEAYAIVYSSTRLQLLCLFDKSVHRILPKG